jgi:methylthioribose-1-phosphate isomerase
LPAIEATARQHDENTMKISGKHYRTIWLAKDGWSIEVIEQTKLPHRFETLALMSAQDCARAIQTMQVRGAPLIGATAAYGVAMALREDASDAHLAATIAFLAEQRPTAINLRWALEEMREAVIKLPPKERAAAAYRRAARLCERDVETCRQIGVHGLEILKSHAAKKKKGEPVNVLTHCNAGWFACVDWGTATSPIYQAHDAGLKVHVWVDETRPRNQGASLTAFELGAHGVPHTIIVDNAGGHLMQRGLVDLCIVGTDRVTANGDVANKIGTYLKALAAKDNGVPFYVALPHSTIDWALDDGMAIPIEQRSADEVLKMTGRLPDGSVVTVDIAAPGSPARNDGFDVTPARLVTGLITERGVCPATHAGLLGLYPERGRAA